MTHSTIPSIHSLKPHHAEKEIGVRVRNGPTGAGKRNEEKKKEFKRKKKALRIIKTGHFVTEQRQGFCDIQVRSSLGVLISLYLFIMDFLIWLMGCLSNLCVPEERGWGWAHFKCYILQLEMDRDRESERCEERTGLDLFWYLLLLEGRIENKWVIHKNI